MSRLDNLANERRWVAWRAESRGDKTTKIPYAPDGRKAKADDPSTWGTRLEAEARAKKIVNGKGGGIGIELGDLGADTHLAGLDLDSCIDNGTVAPWAAAILTAVNSYGEISPSGASYGEISPSGAGLKLFFYIASDNVRSFLDKIGVAAEQWGCRRDAPGADARNHGPAVEVYLAGRYFTVTENRWPSSPDDLRLLDHQALDHLATLIPLPKSAGPGKGNSGDGSRSAIAFAKGGAARRAGQTFEQMCEALRTDPDTAAWYSEKGQANGGRELRRIWARAEHHQVPAFSDEHLALEFAQRHTGELRHTAHWNKWFLWGGTHWRADETLATFDLARALCRDAASRVTNHRAVKLARTIASSRTIYAVVTLARSDRAIATAHADWDADLWRFAGPAPIDLRSGVNRVPLPEDLCTKISGCPPNDRGCPLWLQFLDRVAGKDQDLQRYLQRVAGYCLTGVTREHVMFFMYGTGANGKGVFLNTLRAIWNDYAVVAPMETFIETHNDHHPTEMAYLRGARLVIAQETERGRRWAESKIKSLTGGDPISARYMRQDFFEFTPQFKLIIAGNHKPGLRGVDEAIRRRIHLIPFTVTIPPAERDRELFEKLKAEWGGILQWAVDGCLAWQTEGLAPPQAVIDATGKYLHDEDAMGQWIEERCALDPMYSDTSTTLYSDWKAWIEAASERPGSQRRFSQALEERGFKKEHQRTGAMFIGIALRP